MSDLTTGVAELGQGALLARAAEPCGAKLQADAVQAGHWHEGNCLNCGTGLIGTHCHACGQAAHVHRTLVAFFHDLAHGVFHVEGKIWRTLPMLALRPGRLTREYIDGRRASYLSPIALFLFAVFLLFAAIHMVEEPSDNSGMYTSIDGAIKDQERQVRDLRKQRATARTSERTDALDARIIRLNASVGSLKEVKTTGVVTRVGTGGNVHSDLRWVDQVVAKFNANPDLAVYKLQMAAYKYSWMLIPISVPMLWLLFPFQARFRLYDHTVFVTYSLAFITLLGVIITVLDAGGVPYVLLLGLIIPMHFHRHLKGTYMLSRKGALWRTAALLVLSSAALMVFSASLLSFGMAG